ncbi:MAG: T9SS type A sorting domain-containing protein [Candidatus Kapaibacterium sp.]|nr:T9SS type A sorting domain-containing protein [Bacteroidota bacterium]
MKYFLVLVIAFSSISFASTWQVGPTREFKTPSSISTKVASGDVVYIDSADYRGDVCTWSADNLSLRGFNGRPRLFADGKSAGGKAIWVIKGNNTTVSNIEFLECKVPDKNGAGIRQEGTNLLVQICVFRRNEMGILAGNNILSTITVEYCEFDHCGYGDGFSHNIYINHIYQFNFRFNYSHHAFIGHECKSRAHRNFIIGNRLSNEDGQASREIDLPNGGLSVIMDNVIHQGLNTENTNIIGYGMEGLQDSLTNELYVVNNTIINQRPAGSFIQYQTGTTFLKSYNNIFAGAGTIISGSGATIDSASNYQNTSIALVGFVNVSLLDVHLTSTSPVRGLYTYPGYTSNLFKLTQEITYLHPHSIEFIDTINSERCAGAYPIVKITNSVVEETQNYSITYHNNILYINSETNTSSAFLLYSILGQFIQTIAVNGRTEVLLDCLPEGVYYVTTTSGNKQQYLFIR